MYRPPLQALKENKIQDSARPVEQPLVHQYSRLGIDLNSPMLARPQNMPSAPKSGDEKKVKLDRDHDCAFQFSKAEIKASENRRLGRFFFSP